MEPCGGFRQEQVGSNPSALPDEPRCTHADWSHSHPECYGDDYSNDIGNPVVKIRRSAKLRDRLQGFVNRCNDHEQCRGQPDGAQPPSVQEQCCQTTKGSGVHKFVDG